MSGIESDVISTLANKIGDDVQIKILVKDSNDEYSSNKYKEIFSYKIDKINFMKKPSQPKPVEAPKAVLSDFKPNTTDSSSQLNSIAVPSVSSMASALKSMGNPSTPSLSDILNKADEGHQ